MNKQLQRDMERLYDDHPDFVNLSNEELHRRYWPYFTEQVAQARAAAHLRILARIICWPVIRFLNRALPPHTAEDER